MSAEDQSIKKDVRHILSRHCVELASVTYNAIKGCVTMNGSLTRNHSVRKRMGELTPTVVGAMFWEISRIRKVRCVRAHFDNWVRAGGMWQCTKPQRSRR